MIRGGDYERATHFAEVIARVVWRYHGQRFLGVVDGCGCVELVFSERTDRGNLCTVWFCDDGNLEVAHGGVADPVAYVEACGVQINEAA